VRAPRPQLSSPIQSILTLWSAVYVLLALLISEE
jgi:hypothetical protein